MYLLLVTQKGRESDVMGEITLEQIQGFLVWIIGFVTVLYTVYKTIKQTVHSSFEPVNKKIDNLEISLKKEIQKSDMNSTKNFLVARLEDLKHGDGLDEISKERFFEQYEHYKQLGGNSYIANEVDKLRKEGKL